MRHRTIRGNNIFCNLTFFYSRVITTFTNAIRYALHNLLLKRFYTLFAVFYFIGNSGKYILPEYSLRIHCRCISHNLAGRKINQSNSNRRRTDITDNSVSIAIFLSKIRHIYLREDIHVIVALLRCTNHYIVRNSIFTG